MHVMSFSLDDAVANHLKYKSNKSKYINELVIADLYEKNKDKLADRTIELLLNDVRLHNAIADEVNRRVEAERNHYG